MCSYEEIHEKLGSLSIPTDEQHLRIEWLVDETLAVGRDGQERHVVLLGQQGIETTCEIVERAMEEGHWTCDSGGTISGTRLTLPSGEHYQSAMATIAHDFFARNAATRSMHAVFREVEPLIELVIRRLFLPHTALLGLLGELTVLEWILEVEAVGSLSATAHPTDCWKGYRRTARDFVLGNIALEVKTTSRDIAQHTIDNIDQVDTRNTVERLLLVSIGVRPTEAQSTLSIARLVERILQQLAPTGAAATSYTTDQIEFLRCVQQYGPADCIGYDHHQMSELEPYAAGYTFSYPARLYQITDPNLRLIRRADLEGTQVLAQGIQYRVLLPERVEGSIQNPRLDARRAVEELVVESRG